jgi:MFS family permease
MGAGVMEERDPIQRYLDQLRLSLRIPEVGRILVEAEDHLRAATAAKVADGLTERQAQEAAVAAFGPVHAIVYAHQTRNGRMAAMLADLGISAWRVIAFYLLAAFALQLQELLDRPVPMSCTVQDPCGAGPFSSGTTTAAPIVVWAVTGLAGLGMVAAYFAVRRFQRRRGRVWSVPLGGFFPLAAVVGSVAVGVTLLMLDTTGTADIPGVGAVIYLALGMTVTYGWRMLRMLRQQARDHELA